METDVHYPTDINLLFDAIRKVITLLSRSCREVGINGWRKKNYNLKTIKGLSRKIQKLRRSTSKYEKKKAAWDGHVEQAYMNYVSVVEYFLNRTAESLIELEKAKTSGEYVNISISKEAIILEVERFAAHAYRQTDQIRKRVFFGEKIPHEEKKFPYLKSTQSGLVKVKQESHRNSACGFVLLKTNII